MHVWGAGGSEARTGSPPGFILRGDGPGRLLHFLDWWINLLIEWWSDHCVTACYVVGMEYVRKRVFVLCGGGLFGWVLQTARACVCACVCFASYLTFYPAEFARTCFFFCADWPPPPRSRETESAQVNDWSAKVRRIWLIFRFILCFTGEWQGTASYYCCVCGKLSVESGRFSLAWLALGMILLLM